MDTLRVAVGAFRFFGVRLFKHIPMLVDIDLRKNCNAKVKPSVQ